ncbi:MAG: histidine kinase dimerization/phosphoacceptor domain -containing protein [Candidatus Eremiobacteraeota bacterium]|nr:histidine kinase dimerization/phosphoacceptor domain -containing protein [Candidatus Eremiobacteraeota bacterium]
MERNDPEKAVLDGGAPSCLQGFISDITERTQAGEALRESETRLRSLSDNLPGGLIYQINSGTDGSERRFTYLSGGVKELHETSAAEAMEDPSLIYGQVIEEDRLMVAEKEKAAVETMSPLIAEVQVRLPSGRERWRLFTSAPRRLADGRLVWDGVEIDITGRKQAEESLKSALENHEATLRALPDLLFEIDGEGVIHHFHAPRREELYAPPERFLGKPIHEVLPEDAVKVIKEGLIEAEREGSHQGGTYSLEMHGERLWFELSISSKGEAGPHDRRFVVLARNITTRKRAEEELRGALEERSVLMRELQHRVKNTLVMLTSLVSLEMAQTVDHAANDALRKLQSRILTISNLYGMLYAEGYTADIHLGRYLGKISRSLMREHFDGSRHIELKLSLGEIVLDGKDASCLGLIVNELITNALRHGFPEGRKGTVQVSLREDNGFIILEVADDGKGLPGGFNLARAGGLGLELVTGLAGQLGGEVSWEGGTTTMFTVRFKKQG